MSAFLAWLLANPTLLTIVGGFLAALGWGYRQRRAGAAQERQRQEAQADKAKEAASRVDDAVAGRDPATNRERLSRWSSKP